MIHPYLTKLPERFEEHRNTEDALYMKKYMKNKFDFIGIKTPVRNEILKKYFIDFGIPEKSAISNILLNLWTMNEREYQYSGISLLDRFKNRQDEEDILLYEKLITSKSWWDTVDGLAGWFVGFYFEAFPDSISDYTAKWYNSGNIWLQRTVLLFQLKYKQRTNENLLYEYCRKLSHSREFFIQKAIGWSLREYAKTNPDSVKNFVLQHTLASLSKKEALKHFKKNQLR